MMLAIKTNIDAKFEKKLINQFVFYVDQINSFKCEHVSIFVYFNICQKTDEKWIEHKLI